MVQNSTLFPKIKINIKNPPISGVNLGNYKFDDDKFYLSNGSYSFTIEPNETGDGLICTYKQGDNPLVSESLENIIKCYSLLSAEVTEIKNLIQSLQLQNIVTKDNLSELLSVKIGDAEPTALVNNTIVIPVATETQMGIVKTAPLEKENGVGTDEESCLAVNSVSFDKINQDPETEILFQSN